MPNALPSLLPSLPRDEPDPPWRNALGRLRPTAQDATRNALPAGAAPPQPPPPRQDTIGAATDPGWFANLQRSAAQWAERNDVPSLMSFPPLQLLSAVMGSNPLESVGGPGKAISVLAKRSPELMRRFADPGFHNYILKHGPPKGTYSQLRDHAPESVVEDLWRRYSATPEARGAAKRAAERAAREAGAAQGRRAADRR